MIVNGARIISSEPLQCIPAQFINTHAGITPRYRGSHGAYWSLCNGDPVNDGVTVHLIDHGTDTGGVLYQARSDVTNSDNFTTYPTLQICAGIILLERSINDILAGNERVVTIASESKLWYPPTLCAYL